MGNIVASQWGWLCFRLSILTKLLFVVFPWERQSQPRFWLALCCPSFLIFLCCALEEIQKKRLVSVGSGGYQMPLCEPLSTLVTMLTPQKLKHEEGGGVYILLYLFKVNSTCTVCPKPLVSHLCCTVLAILTLSKSWLVPASVSLALTLEAPF